MQYRFDIPAFLSRYHLPPIMTVPVNDRSAFLYPFEIRGRELCRGQNADFVILASEEMKAFAAQDEADFVAMYAGMFWMLCRLAAAVAASGVFPVMEGSSSPVWAPDLERSLRTPRELLKENSPFDWELESIGWKDATERQMLFCFVLDILFRFVVFHELGHLHNDHGHRKTSASSSIMVMDQLGPPLMDRQQAVASQAREIIADCTGLEMTLRTIEQDITANSDGGSALIRERLAPDKASLVSFVLTVVNLYFRLSDRSDWLDKSIDQLSHPPAPYRMNALFAYIWDSRPLGIDVEIAEKVVQETLASADAVMSVMLNIFPSPNWIKDVTTPENSLHYRALYKEAARWSGPIVAA